MLRIVCFAIVLLAASPAFALPAPMSEAELNEKSDLVALVKILSVTCIGGLPDMATRQVVLAYHAKAELMEVKKGSAKPGDTILIEFNEVPEGVLGPWTVRYFPGEEVWTHLTARGENFRSTWWNARGKLIEPAAIRQLPETPGVTIDDPNASE